MILNPSLLIRALDKPLSFKVLNILDKDYFQPGTESATSGNDFSQRSTGFMNSIIPQPGRSIWFNLGATF